MRIVGDTPTRAEVCALLAVAQAHAFAQPPDAMLRGTLLGQWIGERAGLSADERATAWWFGVLRYLGCTGHAHEIAVVWGDELELRARSLVGDFSEPNEILREIVRHAGADKPGFARFRTVLSVLAGGRSFPESGFRAGCEVADELATRLGIPTAAREALAFSFERWGGRGFPNRAKGEQLPLPVRVVHLGQELEVLARIEGPDDATRVIRRRSGRAYDPALVELVAPIVSELCAPLDDLDPWAAVLACAPESHALSDAAYEDALLVMADFADLKSPFTGGHSRRIAELVAAAGADATTRRAALVHDLGRVAVPNSIWDKPKPLTRSEADRMETHALVTDQLLRRSRALAVLAPTACSDHEHVDGTGYHRRLTVRELGASARLLAAADCYQTMLEPRAHRAALTPDAAAAALRERAAVGTLDPVALESVLTAAGHAPASARASFPSGLTEREVEVLRLIARGLTTKEVAAELLISAKTADRHVQNI